MQVATRCYIRGSLKPAPVLSAVIFAPLKNATSEPTQLFPLVGLGLYGYVVTLLHDHEQFDHPGRVGGEVPWLVRALPLFGVGNGVE